MESRPLNERFRHIMLDLETFGTGTNAAIVSIGAVAFNPETGEVNEEDSFHRRIDLTKSRHPGVIDASTVEWWLRQSDDARKALVREPRMELGEALDIFHGWAGRFTQPFNRPGEDQTIQVWSNPPTFDERLLREACQRYGMIYPFHYRTSRCMRTLTATARALNIEVSIPFVGTQHDAQEDAIHQANIVSALHQRIMERRLPLPV